MNGRHALVIGAANYPDAELFNAVDDANRVAHALRARGFSVSSVSDPDGAAIDGALAKFSQAAQGADLALVYLAGHALERHGSGYFLPVDFPLPPTATGLRFMAISLNSFVEATDGASSRIVVLDACRDWPHDPDEARRTSSDLDELVAAERHWPNLLLAYATSATTRAGDGAAGAGSAFSNALCQHLLDHTLTVDECFRRVSQDVLDARRNQQQPWAYSSLARTLSFTDLPRFAAIQRHSVPNPEHLTVGAWSSTDAKCRSVIFGVGDAMAWRVRLEGFHGIGRFGDDRLMGAAECGGRTFLAGSDGALYVEGADKQAVIELGVPHSFGVQASPTADTMIQYGAGVVTCISVQADAVSAVARHEVGFDVYCCVHLPDGKVWAAGGQGMICEIDPLNPKCPAREITQVRHHVNAMAVSPTGDRIFLVGQSGIAVELDRAGEQVADLLPDHRYKTAAGIRAQLLNFAPDEVIHDYLFAPSRLRKRVRNQIAERLSRPDFPACALAPTLPILAVATQESSVLLLDTRDFQVFQELDVGSGNSTMVAGVHFLSDRELVVIGGRGDVTFLHA